jgi:hypothetical protein
MAEEFPEQTRHRERSRRYVDLSTGKVSENDWVERDFRHQTRVRILCEGCNSGWGSPLEAAVKPLLTPMLRGEACLRSANSARSIAAWATKVAMLWEFLDPPELRVIPAADRHYLRRNNEPPPKTLILAGSILPEMKWGHAASHLLLKVGDPPSDAYISVLGFRRLFFIVCGVIGDALHAQFDISPFSGPTFVRIWPEPQRFMWPTAALNDEIITKMGVERVEPFFVPPPGAELPALEPDRPLSSNRAEWRA